LKLGKVRICFSK